MKRLQSKSASVSFLMEPFRLSITVLLAVLLVTGCKKENAPNKDRPGLESKAKIKEGKGITFVVQAGSSIQAAVDAAAPGTVIKIKPGTYNEAILVNKKNITLMGLGDVITQNPGDARNGITVRDEGDGFVLQNVTIKNFTANGVFLIRVDGFLLSHVSAINNGEYGLFPIFSNNGVIEHCSATGHEDTGIYVGQSTNITMSGNEAFANVNGFEIENCSNVTADKNRSYNNVAGFLVVLLPGLQVKESSNIVLTKNGRENNHVNFADPDGGFEAFVPSGSGILIVGTDETLVQDNHVSGNDFVGIAVVSTVILGSLAGLPPTAFADIEPNPDNVRVTSNTVLNNGAAPPQGLPLPGVDLLWDGSGSGNCWSKNVYKTSYPQVLPVCSL